LVQREAGLLRFFQELVRWTQSRAVFRQERFWTALGPGGVPGVYWHGVRLGEPDWSDDSHSLAFTLNGRDGDLLHVLLNAYWETLDFQLPPLPNGRRWHRLVDTALPPPDDFCPPAQARPVEGLSYRTAARSVVVLLAR
jgi:glycogen operon protein